MFAIWRKELNRFKLTEIYNEITIKSHIYGLAKGALKIIYLMTITSKTLKTQSYETTAQLEVQWFAGDEAQISSLTMKIVSAYIKNSFFQNWM